MTKGLCSDCEDLLTYAHRRLDVCRYGDAKPVCSQCSTHCYTPEKKEGICEIMRFSGPRMLFYSPLDALRHLYRLRKKG